MVCILFRRINQIQFYLLYCSISIVSIWWVTLVCSITDDSTGYEQLYREVWHEDGDKDYMMFWESVVPDWVWLSLFPYLTQGEWYEVVILTLSLSSLLGSAHSQLFPHWSTVSDDRTECCHVTQIVNILRNLSFEDSNSQYLARQEHLIRYMYTVPSAYYHRIWAIVPLSCIMYGLSCCSLYIVGQFFLWSTNFANRPVLL